MNRKQKIVREIAFVLCEDCGYLPLALEPGDLPKIDGHLPNGDPAHFMYREFIPLAKEVYAVIDNQ